MSSIACTFRNNRQGTVSVSRARLGAIIAALASAPYGVAGESPTAVPPTTAAAASAIRAATDDSLARYAPDVTTLFVEVRGLRELEELWSQTDWGMAVSSMLIGRADEPGSGTEALAPLAAALGFDPATARRDLFGRQAAIALPSWADVARGVLLAVPDSLAPIETRLEARVGKPEIIGAAHQYRLDNQNHYLATNGRVLLFGQRAGEHSFYERAVRLLAGTDGKSLADNKAYMTELDMLGPRPRRALLYFAPVAVLPSIRPSAATRPSPTTRPATSPAVPTTLPATRPTTQSVTRPTTQSATQPARRTPQRWLPSTWPTLVRGVVAAEVEGRTMVLDIRGRLDQPAPPHLQDANIEMLNTLPDTTLAAWAQAIDYRSQYQAVNTGVPTLLTLYTEYINVRMKTKGTSIEDGLIARLGRDTIVMLGVIPADRQSVKVGYDMPAIGAIVPVDGPAEVAPVLDQAAELLAGVLSLAGGQTPLKESLQVRKVPFDGTTISVMELSEFFKAQTRCPFMHTLELSWALTDRDLIISSHSDHIRQVLLARAGRLPTLGERLTMVGRPNGIPKDADGVLLAQPAAIAAMFDNWISYLEKNHPEVLQQQWWQKLQQQQGSRVRMGFAMRNDRSHPGSVHVLRTIPGWPAHGRLQADDRILAVDGQALEAADAVTSLKKMIAGRKTAGLVTFTVERKGQLIDVPLALPDEPKAFDPVGAIRQIGRLLNPFSSASYTVWCGPPDRFNARVMLRAAQHPTTQPATTLPSTGTATQSATTARAPSSLRDTGTATATTPSVATAPTTTQPGP